MTGVLNRNGSNRKFFFMKFLTSLFAFALFASFASAQPNPRSVEKWSIFELELKGPTDGNPFVDVRFSAVFTDGTRTHDVAGFYDGDGVYRVRFMPEAV